MATQDLEAIEICTRLLGNNDFNWFLKFIDERAGDNLKGCKTFEEYKYREGYQDGIFRVKNLVCEIIRNTKAELENK